MLPSRAKFHRCGESGATVGEWLPHLAKVADEFSHRCISDGAVVAPVAASVAFSRVYTGVHYPSDVLAGALLAALHGDVDALADGKRLGLPPGIAVQEPA